MEEFHGVPGEFVLKPISDGWLSQKKNFFFKGSQFAGSTTDLEGWVPSSRPSLKKFLGLGPGFRNPF